MGNLHGWIGDRVSEDITGAFGVATENENGRKVVDMCVKCNKLINKNYFDSFLRFLNTLEDLQ